MRRLLALALVIVVGSACTAAPGGTGGFASSPTIPVGAAPGSSGLAEAPSAAQTPSSSTTTAWSPPPVPTVAGRDVYTVSRAIAERDAGTLGNRAIALGGYWSASGAAWSCPYPGREPADLELYCMDGSYGITERYESIMDVITNGNATTFRGTSGPHLSPWIPTDLQERLSSWSRTPPVPIVVLGHFNDSRAAECVADARQTCRDRFVIESILAYDPASAPPATPSPAPTPFPSPAPSGLFDATQCAGDVPYSFIGWTTTDTLHSSLAFDGHVWAVVTRDIVPTGIWNELPSSPGHFNLPMGRRVCVGLEIQPGGMEAGVVLGTGYRQWDDGRRTTADDYGPGSGDPTLPAATSFPALPSPVPVKMHGAGLPDASMTIRDWSSELLSARPATAAELAIPGSRTGPEQTGAAAVLPSDPRSVLIVWAECGSDTSGIVVITKDRQTVLLMARSRLDCQQPGARRGAVLTFGTDVPDAIHAIAGLPLP